MVYRNMVRTCNVLNSDMAAILPMMFVAGLNVAVLFFTITTMLKTVNAKRSHTRIARFLVVTSFWLILHFFYKKNLIRDLRLNFSKIKKKIKKIYQAENPKINKKTAK